MAPSPLREPMSAQFCPTCGKPVAPGAAFCAACGAGLPGAAGASAPTPGPAPPLTFAYPPSFVTAALSPSPASRAADQHALTSVQWAALVAILGTVLSFVSLFGTDAASVLTASDTGGTTSVTVSVAALYLLIALSLAGVALTILEVLLMRDAFQTLKPLDGRFSTPSSLALVLLIAIVLIILGALGIFAELLQAVACAGAGNPIPSTCINAGALLGLVALLFVFAVVAIVGYVGILVGIWRLGTRYDETTLKVGAILLIIPLLNFVGAILVLVGARAALGRLARPPPPGGFG